MSGRDRNWLKEAGEVDWEQAYYELYSEYTSLFEEFMELRQRTSSRKPGRAYRIPRSPSERTVHDQEEKEGEGEKGKDQ